MLTFYRECRLGAVFAEKTMTVTMRYAHLAPVGQNADNLDDQSGGAPRRRRRGGLSGRMQAGLRRRPFPRLDPAPFPGISTERLSRQTPASRLSARAPAPATLSAGAARGSRSWFRRRADRARPGSIG